MMNDLEKFDEAMKKLNDDYNNSQKKLIEQTQLFMSKVSESINKINIPIIELPSYNLDLSYFKEYFENIKKVLNNTLHDIGETLVDEIIPNIEKWSMYGWIISDIKPLKQNVFYKEPESQEDADEIMNNYITEEFISEMFKTLNEIMKNKNKYLENDTIEEAIFCFNNEKYISCINTLMPLFDTELVKFQMMYNEPNKKIGYGGTKKLKKYVEQYSNDFSIEFYFLSISVYNYLTKVLYKNTNDFNIKQDNLNRNISLHGMRNKKYTRLDCIKLFNAYINYIIFIKYCYEQCLEN